LSLGLCVSEFCKRLSRSGRLRIELHSLYSLAASYQSVLAEARYFQNLKNCKFLS